MNSFWSGFGKKQQDGYFKMRSVSDFLEKQKLPQKVDHHQLVLGMMAEQEHTKDKHLFMKAALGHLSEDPDYYSKLKKSKL